MQISLDQETIGYIEQRGGQVTIYAPQPGVG